MSAVQPVPLGTAPPVMNPPTGPYPQMYSGPQPAQVIYIQTTGPPRPRIYENYASRSSKILGIARICIGILSIIFATAAIIVDVQPPSSYYPTTSVGGAGIWCGLFFILCGSFGVAAASGRTMCLIVTNMVLAIVSVSIFGLTYLSLSAAGAGMAQNVYNYDYYNYDYNYSRKSSKSKALVGLFAVMIILALAEIVADIWSSVISCKAVCCCYTPPTQQFVQAQQPGQQMMYLNNPNIGQPTTIPYTPTVGYQYPPIQGEQRATGGSPPPSYAYEANDQKQAPPAFTT